jgi:hypothetical protein
MKKLLFIALIALLVSCTSKSGQRQPTNHLQQWKIMRISDSTVSMHALVKGFAKGDRIYRDNEFLILLDTIPR